MLVLTTVLVGCGTQSSNSGTRVVWQLIGMRRTGMPWQLRALHGKSEVEAAYGRVAPKASPPAAWDWMYVVAVVGAPSNCHVKVGSVTTHRRKVMIVLSLAHQSCYADSVGTTLLLRISPRRLPSSGTMRIRYANERVPPGAKATFTRR